MPIDGRFEVLRQIDTDELGDLIDGYYGPASAELEQADRAIDTLAGEVARLREENQRMINTLASMRAALAEIELILIGQGRNEAVLE